MDEDPEPDGKTETLREIFTDRATGDTVTESQTDERGSLTGDDERIADRIREVIAEMRDRFAFETGLDDRALTTVVRGFYDGRSDAAIAEELGAEPDAVVRARLDLHLLRDGDTDPPADSDRIRELLEADTSVDVVADRLDVEPAAVRRHRAALAARREARSVGWRYRAAFEDTVPAAGIADSLTESVMEDGLEDATAGMETDVSL